MTNSEDSFESSVQMLESDLGLSSGFLHNLRREDDWSFIIKSHAFMEAALSHLIVESLGRVEIGKLISKTSIGGQTGKLAFTKAMGLLDRSDIAFIRCLSELRNKLVHGVSMVTFNLVSYVRSIDSSNITQTAFDFCSFTDNLEFARGGKSTQVSEFFLAEPKLTIWWSTLLTAAIIYQARRIEQLRFHTQALEYFMKLRDSYGSDSDENRMLCK